MGEHLLLGQAAGRPAVAWDKELAHVRGSTRWGSAAELGASAVSVSRHWRDNGLKRHLMHGFEVTRDPRFVEKLEDIGCHVSITSSSAAP